MHASPPALIDTCLSLRIAQLQEVRTAAAAQGIGPWQEGPVGLRREGSGRAAGLRWSRWPLGMESRWRPSVLILGAAPLEAGEALHDGRDDGRRWRHSAHVSLPLEA